MSMDKEDQDAPSIVGLFGLNETVLCNFRGQFYVAKIIGLAQHTQEGGHASLQHVDEGGTLQKDLCFQVHYMWWKDKWDEWVDVTELKKLADPRMIKSRRWKAVGAEKRKMAACRDDDKDEAVKGRRVGGLGPVKIPATTRRMRGRPRNKSPNEVAKNRNEHVPVNLPESDCEEDIPATKKNRHERQMKKSPNHVEIVGPSKKKIDSVVGSKKVDKEIEDIGPSKVPMVAEEYLVHIPQERCPPPPTPQKEANENTDTAEQGTSQQGRTERQRDVWKATFMAQPRSKPLGLQVPTCLGALLTKRQKKTDDKPFNYEKDVPWLLQEILYLDQEETMKGNLPNLEFLTQSASNALKCLAGCRQWYESDKISTQALETTVKKEILKLLLYPNERDHMQKINSESKLRKTDILSLVPPIYILRLFRFEPHLPPSCPKSTLAYFLEFMEANVWRFFVQYMRLIDPFEFENYKRRRSLV